MEDTFKKVIAEKWKYISIKDGGYKTVCLVYIKYLSRNSTDYELEGDFRKILINKHTNQVTYSKMEKGIIFDSGNMQIKEISQRQFNDMKETLMKLLKY